MRNKSSVVWKKGTRDEITIGNSHGMNGYSWLKIRLFDDKKPFVVDFLDLFIEPLVDFDLNHSWMNKI